MKYLKYAFLSLLLGCGCNDKPQSKETAEETVDQRPWLTWDSCSQAIDDHPCNFSLKNQNDDTVELYDFYGKIIVVDLAAMWCGPCASMSQRSDDIVNQYGRENIEWLTLIVETEFGEPPSVEDLQRWADANGVTGHVLGADRSIIDNTAQTGYPVSGWPTYVIIDREMILRYGTVGWSESLIKNQIDSIK